MAEPYQRPVARLRTDDGRVAGAGFLAPRGVIVTCAHVVNDALNRDLLQVDRPADSIPLDLPWAGSGRFRGKVIDWRPPIDPGSRKGDACVDIAVLEVDGPLPSENAVLAQPPTAVPEDTTFKVMGFPAGADAGAPARGSVRGSDAGGWHHVEADQSYGRTIAPGFSGAPAIADGPGRRLLGMLNATSPQERRGVLIPVTALMRAWPPLAEPYRGLEAFREEDAPYFFGRERFAALLWRSFERHPLILLVGPSGSGKSSLINAGFLPRLRAERRWRLVRFRPGDRPIAHLARELVGALKPGIDALALADETATRPKTLLSGPEQLLAYGEACHQATGCGLCIVVDQLEETFSLARPTHPDQHPALLAALASLAGQRDFAPVKVVLGLRSDFQSLLQSDEAAAALVDALNGEPTVMLRPMVPAERERAVLGPLDAAHLDVTLEDGLLGQIMDEVSNNPDALPLLEFALTDLWQRIDIDGAGRRLTRAAYDKIGGVTGALARHADHILDELKIDERQVRRLFMELVRITDTLDQDARRPRSKTELDALDPTLWPLAQRLAEKRLVVTTAEVTTAEPAVDVVHEALFRRWDRLRTWIGEERDFLRWRQRLDERRREWEEARQDPRELLNSRALAQAARWLKQRADALSEQQLRFIQASRDAVDVRATREHADRIWNRLEFNWNRGKIGEDEREALLELQHAPPAVRHEFLFAAVTNEPQARRLCRASGVAFRAAFALQMEPAAAFATKLSSWLARREALGPAEVQAVLLMANETSRFAPELASQALAFATPASAKITDSAQLQAYAHATQMLAGLADAATARAAANALAERATAIAKTTDEHQLQASAQVIQTLASLADTAVARTTATTLIDQATTAIAKTTIEYQPRAYVQMIQTLAGLADTTIARTAATTLIEQAACAIVNTAEGFQLHAYAGMIRALAGLANSTTAQQVIEQAASAMAKTTDTFRSVIYVQIIRSLAGLADAATAQHVIEQAAALAKGTNVFHLWFYAEPIQALAGLADAATTCTAATALVEHAATLATTIDRVEGAPPPEYARTIQALAGLADTATIRTAATALVEQATAATTKTTGRAQLQSYAQTIQALAGLADAAVARAAATALIERTTPTIASIKDGNQLQAYAQTIQALAGLADTSTVRTAARAIFEQAITAIIAGATGRTQLQAYLQPIQALAGFIDAPAAQQVIEQVTAAITKTTDWDQLRAYAQTDPSFG